MSVCCPQTILSHDSNVVAECAQDIGVPPAVLGSWFSGMAQRALLEHNETHPGVTYQDLVNRGNYDARRLVRLLRGRDYVRLMFEMQNNGLDGRFALCALFREAVLRPPPGFGPILLSGLLAAVKFHDANTCPTSKIFLFLARRVEGTETAACIRRAVHFYAVPFARQPAAASPPAQDTPSALPRPPTKKTTVHTAAPPGEQKAQKKGKKRARHRREKPRTKNKNVPSRF